MLLTLGFVGHLVVGLVLLPVGCCMGKGCSTQNTGARILRDLFAPVKAYFLNEDQTERFTKAFLSLKILQVLAAGMPWRQCMRRRVGALTLTLICISTA